MTLFVRKVNAWRREIDIQLN